MARIRQIKPEFYLDDELAACCRDTRLMFTGLWVLADREGRLEERHARIKAQIFPYDSDITVDEIEHFLQELTEGGFISRYVAANGKCLIEIRSFTKHQHCHTKEPPSQLPPPEKTPVLHRSSTGLAPGKPDASTGLAPVLHRSSTGQDQITDLEEVMEKPGASTVLAPGKPGSSPSASGVLSMDNGVWSIGVGNGERTKPPVSKSTDTHTPASAFFLTDELREWAEAFAPNIDPEIEAEKFRDYYQARGKTFPDWPAQFRTWFRGAVDRQNRARAPTGRRESRAERNERIIREVEAEDRAKTMSAEHGGQSP